MSNKRVYLAGPITGESFSKVFDWRNRAKFFLESMNSSGKIECVSPLRGKLDLLNKETSIKHTYDHAMGTSKAIMKRDHHDVSTCDAVLVNFTGAKNISIGTVMEIAWAYELRKPVIVVTDNEIHRHPMIDEAVMYTVPTIEEAAWLITVLFNV